MTSPRRAARVAAQSAAPTNGGARSVQAAHPGRTRIPAHRTLALSLLALAAILGGCRSGTQAPVRNPSAVAGDQTDWFCETGAENQEWSCVQDRELVRHPPATRPPAARQAANATRDTRAQRTPPPRAAREDPPPPPPASVPPPRRDVAGRPDSGIPVMDAPPDYYVVQLVAVQTREALEEYAARKALQGMSAARVERDGRLFYVLLLGLYPDRERARTAASNLPAELAEFDPWVRSVNSLQQAVRRADELAGTGEI